MTGSDAGRVVATTCAAHAAGEIGYVEFHCTAPFEAKLVSESLLAEAERERADLWRANRELMGSMDVASATIETIKAERDALQAQVDAVRGLAGERIAMYERFGEVCSFEGNPMIYASTMEEFIEQIRAALGETR